MIKQIIRKEARRYCLGITSWHTRLSLFLSWMGKTDKQMLFNQPCPILTIFEMVSPPL